MKLRELAVPEKEARLVMVLPAVPAVMVRRLLLPYIPNVNAFEASPLPWYKNPKLAALLFVSEKPKSIW